MDYDYNKWNNYEIGNVVWINARKEHLSKIKFVEYIVSSNYKNILEIGAGEVIEGQQIRKQRSDIKYTVLDVSDTFLRNVRELGFIGVKGEMHNTGFKDKEFDLVYLASVIEHSPDLEKTFRELQRISSSFYITMFKWKMKTGNLEPKYIKHRKYFSTVFNINQLFDLVRKYGIIDELFLCTLKGNVVDYDHYIKKFSKIDSHRNGNYLSMIGRFK